MGSDAPTTTPRQTTLSTNPPPPPTAPFTNTTPPSTAPSVNHAAPALPPCPAKLKRFRFTDAYDVYVLKAVRSADAHLPDWWKTESLYEEVKKIFLRAIPPAVLAQSQTPSGKTFADRFKMLVSRRREDRKRTSAASGIVEKHGEKEQLLDDLMLEIGEKEEAVRVEKEEQTQQEMGLVAAGEVIRDLALKRKSNGESESDSNEDEGSSGASSARKRRRRASVHSDDEMTASMLKQAAQRRELEKRELDLESERVEIERARATREVERFEQMQQSTNRRPDLDEKRFAVEVEERKQSMSGRKKMVDVMALLCKKRE